MGDNKEGKCEYTSVDGTKTYRSSRVGMPFRGPCTMVAVTLVAFWMGAMLRLRFAATRSYMSTSHSNRVALPMDFQATSHQAVAVSGDGYAVALALPAPRGMGIYILTQREGQWDTTLIKDALTTVRNLIWHDGPTGSSKNDLWLTTWADADWYTYQGASKHAMAGQSPFPPNVREQMWLYRDAYAAANPDASRVALLQVTETDGVKLQIFAKSSRGILVQSSHDIDCPLFGEDCLSYYEYGDGGDISSYQWMGADRIAVDMCTMARCSIHVFEINSNDDSWTALNNFTRPSGGHMSCAVQDKDQKMVLLQQQWHQPPTKRAEWTVFTWLQQDKWETPLEQTIAVDARDLQLHHYLEFQTPRLSKDGSVMLLVLVDTFSERPVEIVTLAEAWLYRWKDGAWKPSHTVSLGPDVSQVELSGHGNRLMVFHKDYSFRVVDF